MTWMIRNLGIVLLTVISLSFLHGLVGFRLSSWTPAIIAQRKLVVNQLLQAPVVVVLPPITTSLHPLKNSHILKQYHDRNHYHRDDRSPPIRRSNGPTNHRTRPPRYSSPPLPYDFSIEQYNIESLVNLQAFFQELSYDRDKPYQLDATQSQYLSQSIRNNAAHLSPSMVATIIRQSIASESFTIPLVDAITTVLTTKPIEALIPKDIGTMGSLLSIIPNTILPSIPSATPSNISHSPTTGSEQPITLTTNLVTAITSILQNTRQPLIDEITLTSLCYGINTLHSRHNTTLSLIHTLTQHIEQYCPTLHLNNMKSLGRMCSILSHLPSDSSVAKAYLTLITDIVDRSRDSLILDGNTISWILSSIQHLDGRDTTVKHFISIFTDIIQISIDKGGDPVIIGKDLFNTCLGIQRLDRSDNTTCKLMNVLITIIDNSTLPIPGRLPIPMGYQPLADYQIAGIVNSLRFMNSKDEHLPITRYVRALTRHLNHTMSIKLPPKLFAKACNGLRRLDGEHSTTQALVDVLIKKAITHSPSMEPLDSIGIALVCAGLTNLNGKHPTTKALVRIITTLLSHSNALLDGLSIGTIFHGIKQLDGFDSDTVLFIQQLTEKLYNTIQAQSSISSNTNTTITHDPSTTQLSTIEQSTNRDSKTKVENSLNLDRLGLQNVCLGISSLNGQDVTTKALIVLISKLIQQSTSTFDEPEALSAAFHALSNLDGNDPSTKYFVRILSDKISQIPTSTPLDLRSNTISFIYHGFKRLHGNDINTQRLVNSILPWIEQTTAYLSGYEIGYACNGLQRLNGNLPSTQRLVHTLARLCSLRDNMMMTGYAYGDAIFGLQSLNGSHPTTKELVTKLAVRIEQTTATLTDIGIMNVCIGLRGLDGSDESTHRLVEAIATKIEQSHNALPLTPQQITLAIYGLQRLDGSHSSTLELLKALTNKLLQVNTMNSSVFTINDITNAYYGLQRLDGQHPTTINLLQILLNKLQSSSDELIDGKSLSKACYGLRNLNGQHETTKALVRLLVTKMEQSMESGGLVLMEEDIALICNGLQNLDGHDIDTKRFVSNIAKVLDNSTIVGLTWQEIGDACNGLQNMDGEDSSTKSLVSALTRLIDLTEYSKEDGGSARSIGLALYGLQSLDNQDESTHRLVTALAKNIEPFSVAWTQSAIHNAIQGIRNLDGSADSTSKLLEVLVQKLEDSNIQLTSDYFGKNFSDMLGKLDPSANTSVQKLIDCLQAKFVHE